MSLMKRCSDNTGRQKKWSNILKQMNMSLEMYVRFFHKIFFRNQNKKKLILKTENSTLK